MFPLVFPLVIPLVFFVFFAGSAPFVKDRPSRVPPYITYSLLFYDVYIKRENAGSWDYGLKKEQIL